MFLWFSYGFPISTVEPRLRRRADHRMGVHRLGQQGEMSQATRLDALGAPLSSLALGTKTMWEHVTLVA